MDRNTERILRKLPASVDDRIRQLPTASWINSRRYG